MENTLEKLPREGETETIIRTRVRQVCNNCGEPAHYKHTFLLPNARHNPQSSGYGKDDISWCEDEALFSCKDKECFNAMRHLDGYGWCSTFPASARFAHMFLTWESQVINP